ncbi:MBL fold metallo-hydrolase [Butyrivibrio sp. INlla16]|uniref:MBL fold metallo-hydrolase n=1 Tax=Butyrivibrio sp. INlla16 TaxID=1520807 RepID=UPI00088B725A|nr:MBL fold metallo-hydrolase [Butyrivibrio sp. INlla16]SDB42058.1 Glyoxylase, beta-lactamase superfamily II [Butyrivibrio sp. INlla16]
MTRIDEKIKFLESSDNPLSADIYFIEGNEYTYIIDAGSNDAAFEYINSIDKKKIIITHFHQDHSENMNRINISDDNLYVGKHTRKTIGKGTIVETEIKINDGISIRILPIKNSHAKDSLCVVVNDEYLFLGDSFYSSTKGYNVSLLHDEIALLESITFSKAVLSHDNTIHDRDYVLGNLKEIFALRQKSQPFISNELLRKYE